MAAPAPGAVARAAAYFPALTGIRAVAAWMIFFYHTNPFQAGSSGFRLVREFNSGVGLFFVLSGFLIGSRYLGRVALTATWLAAYGRRRFARIYPLYLLLTAVVITVYHLAPSYDSDGRYVVFAPKSQLLLLVMNATLLRGLFSEFRFSGIMAAWSLTVEACFYAIAPWLLLGLRRHVLTRLLLYAAGLLALGAALVALPAPFHRYGFFDSAFFMLWGTFFGRSLEFMGGLYLAWRLAQTGAGEVSGPPICTGVGLGWLAVCLTALAIVDAPGPQSAATEWARLALNNGALVPGFCLLFYGLVREPTPVRRLLASAPFRLLGQASYAFYLLHTGLPKVLLDAYVTQNVLLKFGLTNVAAVLLYLGFEKPAYRWLVGQGSQRVKD